MRQKRLCSNNCISYVMLVACVGLSTYGTEGAIYANGVFC